MKDHHKLDLMHNLDIEIGRGLKKWTKNNSPSDELREIIIEYAVYDFERTNLVKKIFFKNFLEEIFKARHNNIISQNGWRSSLREKNLTLALCLSTSWRMGI
jgi:predicted nucleotide-binding protein (sugar kinase/HSP70/actin superfamily)